MALAFASARYLTKAAQRTMFRAGLLDLPAEVVLYWFTLCFYGYRQQAGRAALRTLLTYEQVEETLKQDGRGRSRTKAKIAPRCSTSAATAKPRSPTSPRRSRGRGNELMPLADNDIESELSYVYLHAVASRAGWSADPPGDTATTRASTPRSSATATSARIPRSGSTSSSS